MSSCPYHVLVVVSPKPSKPSPPYNFEKTNKDNTITLLYIEVVDFYSSFFPQIPNSFFLLHILSVEPLTISLTCILYIDLTSHYDSETSPILST